MKLYDLKASPNCKKVRVAARELGLSLEIVPVDPQRGGNRTPGYLGKNPMGKVPTLDDAGYVLWESGAILDYLCSGVPGQTLLPSAPRAHAEVLRWMFWSTAHFQPWISVIGQEKIFKPRAGQAPDPAILALAQRELDRFVPILEGQLAGRDFLCGNYSLADIVVGCVAERMGALGEDLAKHPNLRAWMQRLAARESWREG